MKTIRELINNVSILHITGSVEKRIEAVCFDTREVKESCLFVAQKGTKVDGHDYIEQAIEKGAVCIVVEQIPEKFKEGITYIQVKSTPHTLALLSCNFYNNPSKQLKLVGITGTNGKTTTATLLYQLFTNLGFKTGLLSTIENKIGQITVSSTHTTPDAIQINFLLAQMVSAGCEYCFMEVSSHAIVQERIAGLHFVGGVFTNITHEHLDYHKTFKEYLTAKKLFFDNLTKTAFALVNIDDPNGKVMLQNTIAARKTYSLQTIHSDFKAKINESNLDGMNLMIDNESVWFRLVGKFNAYNLLSIYATAILLGMSKQELLLKMSMLEPAEGRFSIFRNQDIIVIVDYAHTPDALLNVLNTIREITNGEQKITTVIGCGGNRDKTKRPEMAKIACQLSDKVIFSSDNPRDEEPEAILNDMMQGISDDDNDEKVLVIADRKQAIKVAITTAKKGEIILIAGKGHEKYQEIKKVKYNFDDVEVAKKYLKI
ncbi:MAG: UDP-N-acetylmuramoyl-L-alanyl-D-glutamate--2,6-diaminopimelate ligase [Bacteroidales bacterium]|jgi:UDP-N-acetylmuramoyl-L-alanyl-D-glutamate--2,6-diaminopimelate ligase|nr:UDP-N-acetylmuramoyl-L-alanyl-D-glutamate--2,6-diaminopimelate ligase [Bacteroidales bacterium]